MKLAEALMNRADLNRKIDQLRSRLVSCALVQEGEKPNEDPNELLRELDESVAALEKLMAQINRTNCETVVDGKTITQIIAEKDAKTLQVSVYRDIVYEAGQSTHRARGTEIKVKPTVNVADMQKKCDDISRRIRLLDNTLQMTNWSTELIEE